MRSNEELQALVLDVVGWQNGLELALIAIEADSPTNAANRAKEKGLTESEVKRTRDLRIALDRALYTPHTLLHEFFNNEQDDQQGRQEMAKSKKNILLALAEIWKEREDPAMSNAAERFLRTEFDPDQIERHLGVQFKWDGSSPPPLDKDIRQSDYYRQSGTLLLPFSGPVEDEKDRHTRLMFTLHPFQRNRGLTLGIRVYTERAIGSRHLHNFSLGEMRVISTSLKTVTGGDSTYGKKSVTFSLREDGGSASPYVEVDIKKNEHDFSVGFRVPGLLIGGGNLVSYTCDGLLFVKE